MNLIEGKAVKIKPFYKDLSRQFLNVESGVFSKNLSIDKEIVPYYGRHLCKMFIKGKPIQFGYKIWMLCSPDKYLFLVEVYTGAEADNSKLKKPLRTRVVGSLIECVTQPENHSLFYDNFFCSYDLVKLFTDKGFKAIGTIRDNRPKKTPLISNEKMKAKKSGEFDYCGNGNVVLDRWNNNSVVTAISN